MNYQNPFESYMKLAAIQTYNIPLTVVLFTLFMRQYQPDTHILIDIVLGIVIALAIFAAYGFSVINTLLCLIYSGIWTYLSYLFFDNNIAWFHSIYATNGKYVVFAICFISFLLLHIKCADSALECFPAFPDIPHFLHKWNTFRKDFFKQKKEMSLKALTDENQKLRTEIDRLKEKNKRLFEEKEKLKSNGITDSKPTSSSPKDSHSNLTARKKGELSRPKQKAREPNNNPLFVYDSYWEYLLDEILEKILQLYFQAHNLDKECGIRILAQQPLSNYVSELSEKKYNYARKVNNKNHFTQFDFLIEFRKKHIPLLAIELDGPCHHYDNSENAQKTKDRDDYKDGACSQLGIPILHIPCKEEAEITEENIMEKYQDKIASQISASLIKHRILNELPDVDIKSFQKEASTN